MTNKIGIVYALIASISWGFAYNIDQKLVLKSNPLTLFIIGSFIQGIVLLPYIFTSNGYKDILAVDKQQFYLIFLNEMILLVAGVSILYSIKHLTAPIASAFEISYPFFVVLFSYLIFDGNVSTKLWIGLFLIFIGSFIISR